MPCGMWPQEGEAPAHLAQGHCRAPRLELAVDVRSQGWVTKASGRTAPRQLPQACMVSQEICFASYSSGLTLGAGTVRLAKES